MSFPKHAAAALTTVHFVRKMAGGAIGTLVLVLVAVGAYAAGRTSASQSSPAAHVPRMTAPVTPSTAGTIMTTTTAPPPPPPPTTTVPMVAVPDVVTIGNECGCSGAPESTLKQDGFAVQTQAITQSGACYYMSPSNGQQMWNAGSVIGQSPNAGTELPVGSTVTLDICAGQAQFP